MTHDDILRMAREAGWHDGLLGVSFTVPLLERFAALVTVEKDKEIERLQVALTEAHAVREACNQRAFRLEAEVERLRDELRQSSIDYTRAEVERLREALLRIRETKVFLGAIAQEMMEAALRQEGTNVHG